MKKKVSFSDKVQIRYFTDDKSGLTNDIRPLKIFTYGLFIICFAIIILF